MRSYPRIRKTVKWTSAVMVVVLMVAWAVSLKWNVGYKTNDHAIELAPHCMSATHWPARYSMSRGGGFAYRVDATIPEHSVRKLRGLWFRSYELGASGRAVDVPLWFFIAVFAACWMVAWRRDKRLSRIERGRCVKCGYDRAGLKDAGAACPECGARP